MSTDGSDLVVDITKLELDDNFYTWFTRTNSIIDAINPLNIYDITPRKGLSESRSGGNVILDVDTGKGIKAYPNPATGAITLDFEALTAKTSITDDDLFVIETPTTGSSNDLFKVSATNMLPPTLTGNHEFTGTITVNALNVRDNALRLQFGDATTENDAGIILDTTSSSKVKFTYDTTRAAWFSNRNIGLQNGYSFLTNSSTRRAEFRFSTHGSSQFDTGLELLMGQQSTQGDDHSWIIEARNVDRAINFIYKNYFNTDTENRIFYAQVDSITPFASTFVVADKIQIGNIAGSTTNFKNITNYSANIIPISNSDGILDNKWTNRYVTTQHSGIAVGDIVKLYDDTNNQATVVKSELTSSSSEEEAYSLGIVERLSGGKAYVVTHGQFDGLSGLLPGSVYYLTTGSPNYTTTKPTSGIVKPVFIATSATGGIFFPMSAQGLSFGRATVSAGAGGTASGSAPVADAPTDTLNFVAGAGINLVANPASTSIQISAATAGNQPTYSSFATDSGTVAAFQPSETLLITGDSGGIEVIADNKVDTNGDKLTIKGKYFRTVSWIGDSSTNDIPGSKTATYDDNLQIYAGTGIGIREYLGAGGGILIEATGQSVASVANGSITLAKLATFNPNSVLIGNSSGTPTLLSTANNTLLNVDSTGSISWATPLTILQEKFAKQGFDIGYYEGNQAYYGVTQTRNFGIIKINKNANNIGNAQGIDIASFRYNTKNSINGAILGLQEGDGIQLDVQNTITNVIDNVPSIKITNKYGPAFNKIYISDTNEIIEANGVVTKQVRNRFASSKNLNNTGWILYKNSSVDSMPTRSTVTTITWPDGTTANGTRIDFNSSTGNNGVYGVIYSNSGSTAISINDFTNKTYTVSVYAACESGTQTFRISYYPGTSLSKSVFSPTFTVNSTTPQRFTWTFTAYTPTSGDVYNPNIAFGNGEGATGQHVVLWGAQIDEGPIATDLITTTTPASTATNIRTDIVSESHGVLTFNTNSSPILLDSDTNSDTIYFNIANNSITNNYLATMGDNTVKVGTGSTNANNTPQDLTINSNSVLGRVGNGDLKSVSASELATMIGSNYFTSVETDSGTVFPSETNTIKLKGGSGITVTENTGNEIIITNTGGGGGTGSLSLIGDWNSATSTSENFVISKEKLYFGDGDLQYNVSSLSGDSLAALVTSTINWKGLTTATSSGAGLLYGKGGTSSNTDRASITTSFEPIGNNTFSSGVTKDCIPYIDSSNDTLSYVKRASTGQTTAIDRVIGFDSSGSLVATSNFISNISFSGISGLTFSSGTLTATNTAPVSFPLIRSSVGIYYGGSSSSLGLSMSDMGTEGTSDFTFATSDDLSSITNWSNTSYITLIRLAAHKLTTSGWTPFAGAATEIKTRLFSTNWLNLSTNICMPRFLIGLGPLASTATTGQGMLLRNDTTNNSLTFTNYNLNATGSKTITKDRSCRLGLEVLDVDNVASNAYANTKNTAYITHTYVPKSGSSIIVDQFPALPINKSYKYLVHAENASGDFYTTELLVQVKGSTTVNLIQYASSTTSGSLNVTYTGRISGGNVLIEYGTASAGSLDIKFIKYEV